MLSGRPANCKIPGSESFRRLCNRYVGDAMYTVECQADLLNILTNTVQRACASFTGWCS